MPYLFCYFTGNEPENESVHFAVSDDGFHFTALNGNRRVITQTMGKGCCRDPFLFRDQDGMFHILATDMRCYDGWNSNHTMIFWDSVDLVHWTGERILDFSQFPATRSADRVWAPQALYDPFAAAYMIYWTHHNAEDGLDTVAWYAYSDDLRTLKTPPQVLYCPAHGQSAVDADIVLRCGCYYLFEADGKQNAICYAVAKRPNGPYYTPEHNRVSVAETALEGQCTYQLPDGSWLMIADQFRKGGYFMQRSKDLIHFEKVTDFALDHLHPRHGSMLRISETELRRLLAAFPAETAD